jgi:hypothetical protein
LNNFHPSPEDTYTILLAAGGVAGNFSHLVDSLNNSGLTLTEVVTPNGVLVSYLRPVPTPAPTPGVTPAPPPTLVLSTPKPLPTTPLTRAQKNAILVPVVDPNLEQLAAPFEVWFSGANIQRFNTENRFDDIIAGSTGFVSDVTYPMPPPTGKQVTEGKGVADEKGPDYQCNGTRVFLFTSVMTANLGEGGMIPTASAAESGMYFRRAEWLAC